MDVAVSPSETAVSYALAESKPRMVAIATILQKQKSAIFSRKATRPKELDGKIYASYDARLEDDIVREIIRNDGGQGNIESIVPPKLGCLNTILSHRLCAVLKLL